MLLLLLLLLKVAAMDRSMAKQQAVSVYAYEVRKEYEGEQKRRETRKSFIFHFQSPLTRSTPI